MPFPSRLIGRLGCALCLGVCGLQAIEPPAAAAVPGEPAAPDPSIIPKYEKINPARKLLSPAEIQAALTRLPGWKAEGGKLTKTFVRKNFVEAIAFINALVPECERLDHHPEIFTVYNKVNLTLTTHDAGRKISSFDVLLAERIEAVASPETAP